MKRDANLVPLSRQHFRTLVLCMRIHRKRAERGALQREMLELWEGDVRFHFQAEEKYLFPAAARRRVLKGAELTRFAALLEGHIRKEERRLFEECQKEMSDKELSGIGARMQKYFQKCGATAACKLPVR